MHLIRQPRQWIYLISACGSLLLSWVAAKKVILINPDGICYLQTAASIHLGLTKAMTVCDQASWPFYSFLIAGLSRITAAPLETAAFALNAFFSLVSTLLFIGIVDFLSNAYNKKIILSFAAIVILLGSEWSAVKHYIIRDHGFWSFYLASLFCLLLFFRRPHFLWAIGWNICMLCAGLFRVEAAIFLFFIPFLVFFDTTLTPNKRLFSFLQLSFLSTVMVVFLYSWYTFHPAMEKGRLSEIYFQFHDGFSHFLNTLNEKIASLRQTILPVFSAKEAGIILGFTLLGWYVYLNVICLSVIFTILFLYAYFKKLLKLTPRTQLVLAGYIGLNIIITIVFLIEHLFLSKRYLVALSLTLMLWVPFALAQLFNDRSKQGPLLLALGWIGLASTGGIIGWGYSKTYIRQAGDWLACMVPADKKIYSNDLQIMYYSNHFDQQIFSKYKQYAHLDISHAWQQYDYIVLRVDKNTASLFGKKPIQVFANKRGDQIRIYRNVT